MFLGSATVNLDVTGDTAISLSATGDFVVTGLVLSGLGAGEAISSALRAALCSGAGGTGRIAAANGPVVDSLTSGDALALVGASSGVNQPLNNVSASVNFNVSVANGSAASVTVSVIGEPLS